MTCLGSEHCHHWPNEHDTVFDRRKRPLTSFPPVLVKNAATYKMLHENIAPRVRGNKIYFQGKCSARKHLKIEVLLCSVGLPLLLAPRRSLPGRRCTRCWTRRPCNVRGRRSGTTYWRGRSRRHKGIHLHSWHSPPLWLWKGGMPAVGRHPSRRS